MPLITRSAARDALGILLLGIALGACAGPPIQEMSNARQAVRAATHAGAESSAAEPLAEAQRLLKAAEGELGRGEYREAREHAEQARGKAMEARRIAESAGSGQP